MIGLFSAQNTIQLFNSLVYLPLIFYFGIRILHFANKSPKSRKSLQVSSTLSTPVTKPTPIVEATPIRPITPVAGVADNDKRLFLKLIGSAGVSLVFMALFTKKAQASFFGSAPVGPGLVGIKDIAGNKIDPAEKKPTDGYEISNIDDVGNPQYYGFIKKTGDWYIMQKDAGTFLYAKGANSYSINWTIRGTLIFDYYNNVFG
jgi:hypothetical protein